MLCHKDLDVFKMRKSAIKISGIVIDQYDWYNKDTNEHICSVQTFEWWDGLNASGLEIQEQYKGNGLSYAVLDYAVSILGAKNIAVEKTNKIARHAYKKYGFVDVDEDDTYYYMKYM